MTVEQCYDRPAALHNIFMDMNSVRTVKPVTPFYDENSSDTRRPRLPMHIPVKRSAVCPPSHHMVAVPKRSRMHAVSNAPTGFNAQGLRSQSYMLAVPQPSNVAPNLCYTPTHSDARVNKRLAFAPLNNQSRQNAASSCCAKENLCFGAFSGNQGVSTPPYGTNNDSYFGPSGNRGKRRLARKQQQSARKPKRNSMVKQARVISNSKAFNTNSTVASKENIPEGLSKQPSAMSMYNTFLRQLESENENKKKNYVENYTVTRDESRRYSPGFAPSLTSTPQKSPPASHMSTPKASTATSSGYCSRPSNAGSSSYKTENGSDDSFARFICFIEDGVLTTNKQFLNGDRNLKSVLDEAQSLKNDSAFENSQHINNQRSRQQKYPSNNNNNNTKSRRFITSTPVSEVSDSSTNVKCPSHPYIGAPLATSSPVHTEREPHPWVSFGQIDNFVWRPWC